jgi:hypothetical protein
LAAEALVDSDEIDRVELDGVSRPIRIFAVDEKQT